MQFCGMCGSEIGEGDRFCRFCGAVPGPSGEGATPSSPLINQPRPPGWWKRRRPAAKILIVLAIVFVGMCVLGFTLEALGHDETPTTNPGQTTASTAEPTVEPSVVVVGAENSYDLAGHIPDEWLADPGNPARIEVKFEDKSETQGQRYIDGRVYRITRQITLVTVTDLQSRAVVAEHRLFGEDFDFPDFITQNDRDLSRINKVSKREFVNWLKTIMSGLGFKT